jgi:hypothetical protein
MWICNNCGNQNEDNFKFCWSCGKPKSVKKIEKVEIDRNIPLSKPTEYDPERNDLQVSESKPKEIPKIDNPPTIKNKEPEAVKFNPVITKKTEKRVDKTSEKPKKPQQVKSKVPEPELFSTFLPENEKLKVSDEYESNWENIIFTSAVRLTGLYFIFLVLLSIPDFIALLYSFISTETIRIKGFGDVLAIPLFILSAKLLFYLFLGIYLISSGRILLWLMPRK